MDALRDREPQLVARLRAHSLDGEQAHDLAYEQWIPLGLLVQRGDQLRSNDLGGHEIDVLGDLRLGEPAERAAPRDPLAGYVGEQLGQRRPGRRVDVPVGRHDQEAHRAERAGDEPQRQQRRLVGGMQIVEHEHERTVDRGVAQEDRDRVEEAEAGALRLERRGRRKIGEALAQLGDYLRKIRRASGELSGERVVVGLLHAGPQRLRPGPIGRRAARLPAAADDDPGAAGVRLRCERLREPALADARLAGQEQQAATAGKGTVQAVEELRELGAASDERAGQPRAGSFESPQRRKVRDQPVGGHLV